MTEIVINVMFAIPAVLGLAEIIHAVKLWLLKPKSEGKRILVLIPDTDDFEGQILSLYEQFKWQGKKLADKIVVVDYFVDEKEECKRITGELKMEVCSLSELADNVL